MTIGCYVVRGRTTLILIVMLGLIWTMSILDTRPQRMIDSCNTREGEEQREGGREDEEDGWGERRQRGMVERDGGAGW